MSLSVEAGIRFSSVGICKGLQSDTVPAGGHSRFFPYGCRQQGQPGFVPDDNILSSASHSIRPSGIQHLDMACPGRGEGPAWWHGLNGSDFLL